VLGFELDRQTPFKSDQVWFDSRVLSAEPAARQAQVELSVVQRVSLEAELERIGALAGGLSGVDVEDAEGRRLGVNLLPPERRLSLPRTWLMVQLGLVLASVLLVFFAMGQVVENRREAVAQMEQRVDAERERARAVSALRTQLDEAAAGANFLAVQKQTQPSMLVLLHEVSRLLPDDTFLERLSLSAGQLSLTGYSSQATRLISQMQESPLLREPALNGAIQPDARTGRDRFTITASYGPVRAEGRP
jgi:general secretion pathway protein L